MRRIGLSILAFATLSIGCQETATAPEGPFFAKGGGKGPPPPAPSLLFDLPDLTIGAGPGVYGDGASYTALAQDCSSGREITVVAPTGLPAGLVLPATCPDDRRSNVHLPGDPLLAQDPYGDSEPSYVIRGGKVKPTGWMSPTLNYTWNGCGATVGFDACNFVWTDGNVTGTATGSVVTGHCAKLYVGQDPAPVSPTSGATCSARHEGGFVDGFPLDLSVVVTVQP